MFLPDAERRAAEILDRIRPFCFRAEVAGSVRRKKSVDIKDIEIVAVPNPIHAFSMADVVNRAWGPPSIGAFPSKYTRIRSVVNIDFFFPTRETWGMIYFIRTGSAEFVTRALTYWKKVTNGGYSKDGILHLPDGTPVPTPEEEDVFTALATHGPAPCPFVPPELRTERKRKRVAG